MALAVDRFGTLLLSVVVILPAMFVIAYYFPKLDAVMNVLILLPVRRAAGGVGGGADAVVRRRPAAAARHPWDFGGLLFHHRAAVYLPRHQQQHAGDQPARF